MTTLPAATPVVHSQASHGSRVTGAGEGEATGALGVAQPTVWPRVAAPHAVQLALLAVLLEMTLSVAVALEMVLAVEVLDSAARALEVEEFFGIGAEGTAYASCTKFDPTKYPNYYKLYKLTLTWPIGSVKCERLQKYGAKSVLSIRKTLF